MLYAIKVNCFTEPLQWLKSGKLSFFFLFLQEPVNKNLISASTAQTDESSILVPMCE